MKVAGGCQIVKIEILKAQFGDCAWIREDVALGSVGQNESHAGLCAMRDARQIDTAFPKAFQREGSERVIAYLSDEPHAAAKSGKIMRQDGRGTAQRDGKAAGQQFAFRGHVFGQPVEDQVKIDLPDDRDIEIGHGAGLLRFN
jgi:hypothetical protein